MKYLILILAPTFLLIATPEIRAHNLASVTGNIQDHQHVYRRQQYGRPLQQGHLFQSPGVGSMILWESGSRSDYGKSNGRRSGPIIGDQKPMRGATPRLKNKYGSTVNGYGKAVHGYGKSDRD